MNYNDGSLIEPDKFLLTVDELCERFGGINQDTTRVSGTLKYGGTRYRDDLIRMHVDSDDPNATAYLRAQKEIWKNRFQQIDI